MIEKPKGKSDCEEYGPSSIIEVLCEFETVQILLRKLPPRFLKVDTECLKGPGCKSMRISKKQNQQKAIPLLKLLRDIPEVKTSPVVLARW